MFSQPQRPSLKPHPTHCTSGKRTAISPDWVIYLTHGRDGYCNWCAQGALVSGAYQLNKLNKDTTHCQRVLHRPTFRSRNQTLASLQRNARNPPARERKDRREPRNARFGLARANAEAASPARQGTPTQ